MNGFTKKVRCPVCRTSFQVELSRMRLNYPHCCPKCTSPFEISTEQAIQAHRLLEKLESMKRVSDPQDHFTTRGPLLRR